MSFERGCIMKRTYRRIAVALATGTLIFIAATPVSAATSSWYWSNQSHVKVGNCWLSMQIANNNVTVIEEGSSGCPGLVYAQAQWTNGQSTYTSSWSWGSEVAVAGQFMSVAVRGQHS